MSQALLFFFFILQMRKLGAREMKGTCHHEDVSPHSFIPELTHILNCCSRIIEDNVDYSKPLS